MKIYLDANPDDAPCCIKIEAEDGRDLLVQTDWEWPSIASTFGWVNPCKCGASDGTVDCSACSLTANEIINSAREYIDDNNGAEAEDPGYFNEE